MPLSNYDYDTRIIKSRLAKEMQILDTQLGNTKGQIVLDAGAGTSEHHIKAFTARELTVITMDIIIDNLRTAWNKSDTNITLLLAGDVNNIPLATESVDILFMGEVLEHLNTPEKALSEAHRVLKRGGHIFVDVPWMHEMYRPLSALILRNLVSFKRSGNSPLLLRMLFSNLSEINKLKEGSMLKRRWFGSLLINLARLFPTFRSYEPEYFIYNHYHGTIPEGNMHLQFRFPKEWADTISKVGFNVVRKTGAYITPPLLNRSRLCNMLSCKLESHMEDNLLSLFSQILIVVAVKT